MISVGDKQIPWKDGLTVAQLLESLPDAGDIAVIRLNGKTVSRPRFEETVVPDCAEIVLIPMIAGG